MDGLRREDVKWEETKSKVDDRKDFKNTRWNEKEIKSVVLGTLDDGSEEWSKRNVEDDQRRCGDEEMWNRRGLDEW